MTRPAIVVEGLRKRYGRGGVAVEVLRGVDMRVMPGEVVGLLGASGSGKSTLLQCLGAIVDPDRGYIELGGETVFKDGWKYRDLRALRRDRIGFVFQRPYLISFLDVLDNVAILPMLQGLSDRAARRRAMEVLDTLGIGDQVGKRVEQLSGGQQQRVAIARALVNRPSIILADEPTAPLDRRRALSVVKLLEEMAQHSGAAVIVVTHDEHIIPLFQRCFRLVDGKLCEMGTV